MFQKRGALAVLGVLVLGSVLAGCGSTPTASSGPATTNSAAATTSTTAASTTTVAPSTSTSTTVAPSACTHDQLSVSAARSGAAAGTIEIPFTVTNTATTACVIDGYPTVVLVPKSGTVSPQVSHSGQGAVFSIAPTAITLPAGSTGAAFVIAYNDVQSDGQTSCPQIVEIDVTLPGSAGAFQFPRSFSPCGAPNIDVSAVITDSQYKSQFDG